MRKGLSIFMLNMSSKMKLPLITMAVLLVVETAVLLIGGLQADNFGQAVNLIERAVTGLYIILLTMLLIKLFRSNNLKANSNTSYTFERIGISKGAAYFWSVLAGIIRFASVLCFQTLLLYVLFNIYNKAGANISDALTGYLDSSNSYMLYNFFPGNDASLWVLIIVSTILYGMASAILTIKYNWEIMEMLAFYLFLIIIFSYGLGGPFDGTIYRWAISISMGVLCIIILIVLFKRSPDKEGGYKILKEKKK